MVKSKNQGGICKPGWRKVRSSERAVFFCDAKLGLCSFEQSKSVLLCMSDYGYGLTKRDEYSMSVFTVTVTARPWCVYVDGHRYSKAMY